MKPERMISFMVSPSGKGTFPSLTLWNFNPPYQYCWFCRGMEGSQRRSVILEPTEERMVRMEYRKPR